MQLLAQALWCVWFIVGASRGTIFGYAMHSTPRLRLISMLSGAKWFYASAEMIKTTHAVKTPPPAAHKYSIGLSVTQDTQQTPLGQQDQQSVTPTPKIGHSKAAAFCRPYVRGAPDAL